MTLLIDGRPVGKGRMNHTVPVRFSGYSGMDIGRDNGGVVDRSYENEKPFAFTGLLLSGGRGGLGEARDGPRDGPGGG